MADTTFTDRQTPIVASWLNDVNDLTYNIGGTGSGQGASRIGVQDIAGNFTVKNVEAALASIVGRAYASNVALFPGADSTGITDSTSAFVAAAATGKAVYVPEGIWSINWTILRKICIIGEGSFRSIIKPFNVAIAAIVYNPTSQITAWVYDTHVSGIGFNGIGTKTGVGFTFGATLQSQYALQMELANGVTFYNCRWYNLQKGVQCPFGNIGVSFYDCGWTLNYYGVYSIDNKWVGTTAFPGAGMMHAGNKYFFSGQFDNNTCAVYVHNQTLGFGGVQFSGTIFEYNLIALMLNSIDTAGGPVILDNFWNEGNGAAASAGTVNIDAVTWSVGGGPVFTPTATQCRSIIVDTNGAGASVCMEQRGGFFCDTWLRGSNIRYITRGARIESKSTHGGNPSAVSMQDSEIIHYDPETTGGGDVDPRIVTISGYRPADTIIGDYTLVEARTACCCPRFNKGQGAASPKSLAVNFTASSPMVGSVTVTNTVVSDGVIFPSCNQYSATFTAAGQVANSSPSSFSVPAGKWAVCTVDTKVTAGSLYIYFWDGSANRLLGALMPLNSWISLSAIGYNNTGAAASMFLSVYSNSAVGSIWLFSAFQVQYFDTRAQAEAFLNSNTYIG